MSELASEPFAADDSLPSGKNKGMFSDHVTLKSHRWIALFVLPDRINLVSILIFFWEDLNIEEKKKKISPFLTNFENITYLVDYFEEFRKNLTKKNLKSFLF